MASELQERSNQSLIGSKYRYICSLAELTRNYINKNGKEINEYTSYLFCWTAHFFFLLRDHKFYDFAIDSIANGDYLELEDESLYFKMLFNNLMGFKYKRSDTQYKIDNQILIGALLALEKACFSKKITIDDAIYRLTEIVKAITRIKIRLKKKISLRLLKTLRQINISVLTCWNTCL